MGNLNEMSQDIYNIWAGQVPAAINSSILVMALGIAFVALGIAAIPIGKKFRWETFSIGTILCIAVIIGIIVFCAAFDNYNTLIHNPDKWIWNRILYDLSDLL